MIGAVGIGRTALKPAVQAAAALMIALAAVWVQMHSGEPRAYDPDSGKYLSVAIVLHESGVFTDGLMSRHAVRTGPDGQGMFFAPLYPAFLAAVMKADAPLAEAARCAVAGSVCGSFSLLYSIQGLFAAAGALAVWLAGYVITGRLALAWAAMGLALAAEAFAHYAGAIMTEALALPLFAVSCLLAVLAVRCGGRKRMMMLLAYGASLGALALVRPSCLYLFLAAVPVTAIAMLIALDFRSALAATLVLVAGFAIVSGPWIMRNGLATGSYKISEGYAGFIFVQRAAFNEMRSDEWRASFVYGLPDFGDSLCGRLFDPESCQRLDYANPEGFYQRGNNQYRAQSIEKAGGKDRLLGYLLKEEVIGNAGRHIAVSLSLAWRGMWVSKYWGLAAIPLFAAAFFGAVRRRCGAFIVYSLPAWFMLGFHAFTSVNVVRYNLVLVPCLALGSAMVLLRMWEGLAGKYRQAAGKAEDA